MIIAIDFDGTCVTDEFPKIGKDIGAVPYSNKLFIDWDTIDTFLDYIYNAYDEKFPKKP